MSELEKLTERAKRSEELVAQLQTQVDFLQSRFNQINSNANNSNVKYEDRKINISSPTTLSKEQIEDLLVKDLNTKEPLDSRAFGSKYNIHPDNVYGAISSLSALKYIKFEQKQSNIVVVSNNGQKTMESGSPEFRLYTAVPASGTIGLDSLQQIIPNKKEFNIGLHHATNIKKILSLDKNTNLVSRAQENAADIVVKSLRDLQVGKKVSTSMLKELKKRKMTQNKKIKYYIIKKDTEFKLEIIRPLAEITIDDIERYMDLAPNTNDEEKKDNEEIKENDDNDIGANDNCEWKGPPIKPINVNSYGQSISHGNLHPLMKMRADMRRILLDLGFEEMETNRYVESSFWNFDALFQPQQHPARDAHDTFFLSQPKESKIILRDYLDRVKQTHEKGLNKMSESIGWRYDWKESEAKKNLLRTHTTAVSSRTLYKLAQNKPFKPKKYFSIDRVFRNESIDPTHLAEFHQVEGFVADYDLTLGHLIGTIAEFFKRIGIPDVKFKPAYNPYTEPSMEIFGWSEERKKWIEVGNSGVFRPEMLRPMGLPENVRVIAWGLGLERPCMIATGCKDIRELFGPRVNVNMVDKFPFVRYDREVLLNEKIKESKSKNSNSKKKSPKKTSEPKITSSPPKSSLTPTNTKHTSVKN